MDKGFYYLIKMYLNQPHTYYRKPIQSNERYAKSSQATTLICLPCCHFGLQLSRNLKTLFCHSDESLNYKLPTFDDF